MSKNLLFTQILITRFSVRIDGHSVLRDRPRQWLFSEHRLNQRIALFSSLTFPSIIKSSQTPDYYIVVIDKDLPDKYKLLLADLAAGYDWVLIHEWNPEMEFNCVSWVLPLVKTDSTCLLMSQIDDDDALELGANERIREKAAENVWKTKKGEWVWLGSNNAIEWDLICESSRFGFLKPYSGGVSYWQAVGTSILVPNNVKSPTSYGWTHSMLHAIFKSFLIWSGLPFLELLRFRLGLIRRLIREGRVKGLVSLFWRGWLVEISEESKSSFDMLITNSGTNLQDVRLDLGKDKRKRATVKDLAQFGVTADSLESIVNAYGSKKNNLFT